MLSAWTDAIDSGTNATSLMRRVPTTWQVVSTLRAIDGPPRFVEPELQASNNVRRFGEHSAHAALCGFDVSRLLRLRGGGAMDREGVAHQRRDDQPDDHDQHQHEQQDRALVTTFVVGVVDHQMLVIERVQDTASLGPTGTVIPDQIESPISIRTGVLVAAPARQVQPPGPAAVSGR